MISYTGGMADDTTQTLTLNHLNIRQSIFILLVRIIGADILFSLLFLALFALATTGGIPLTTGILMTTVVFVIMSVVKLSVITSAVIQWLYEYYELSPEYLIHKRGFFYKKQEKYKMSNVRAIKLSEGILGEIFDFGTIAVYDIRMQKYLDLYWVHNPNRYLKIFADLKPDIEIKKEKTIFSKDRD